MTRFVGNIAYVIERDIGGGDFQPDLVTHQVTGEFINQSSSWTDSQSRNGELSLRHRISVIWDSKFPLQYYNLKYIEIDGFKWEVAGVEVKRPRLLLTLGGPWSGNTTSTV